MISKMLVVLDGSEPTLTNLKQSLALARSENASLELVSVVPAFEGDLRMMGSTRVLEEQKALCQGVLDKGLELARQHDITARPVLLEGEPYAEIVFRARQSQPDLIVLNKKNPYLTDLIPVGAVATRVISEWDRDVLILSRDSSLHLERILLAFDNSANARKAADKAIDLALAYGSELIVTSVYEVPLEGFAMSPDIWGKISKEVKEIQEQMAMRARDKGVRKVETRLKCGSTYQELINAAQDIKAGMIMMGARRKSGIFKFRLGNVMDRVICNGSFPVWVVAA